MEVNGNPRCPREMFRSQRHMKHGQAVPENTRFVFLAAYPVWFLLWAFFLKCNTTCGLL